MSTAAVRACPRGRASEPAPCRRRDSASLSRTRASRRRSVPSRSEFPSSPQRAPGPLRPLHFAASTTKNAKLGAFAGNVCGVARVRQEFALRGKCQCAIVPLRGGYGSRRLRGRIVERDPVVFSNLTLQRIPRRTRRRVRVRNSRRGGTVVSRPLAPSRITRSLPSVTLCRSSGDAEAEGLAAGDAMGESAGIGVTREAGAGLADAAGLPLTPGDGVPRKYTIVSLPGSFATAALLTRSTSVTPPLARSTMPRPLGGSSFGFLWSRRAFAQLVVRRAQGID